jgi:hypothetical protein
MRREMGSGFEGASPGRVPRSFAFCANEWAGRPSYFLTFNSYRTKDSSLPGAGPRARSC